ncbi:MAG TPA: cupin domain-containing protein [Verrucomicrobiae bacterium]|jgi:quercetin dioxygenase-like cupin family protein|nr:cupin domain-containing protein [Verrucomicrobiae bacterium]
MNPNPVWKFVSSQETVVEKLDRGAHLWHCRPDLVKDTNLLMVRVQMPPGQAHKFHRHPRMEEILYILSGTAEQWVDKEKRILKPGDSVYLAADIVHGTYNIGPDTLDFLAILSPAQSEGPATVDVFDEEPWKSLRG